MTNVSHFSLKLLFEFIDVCLYGMLGIRTYSFRKLHVAVGDASRWIGDDK